MHNVKIVLLRHSEKKHAAGVRARRRMNKRRTLRSSGKLQAIVRPADYNGLQFSAGTRAERKKDTKLIASQNAIFKR